MRTALGAGPALLDKAAITSQIDDAFARIEAAARRIHAFERDRGYRRLNALLLRNTSVINFLNCCAITVPIHRAGPPVGLMIVGAHGADCHLLEIGRGIESAVNKTR